MSRMWELSGPDSLKLTVKEVAALFGYEAKTWRRLVRDGHAPRPRGSGQGEFYTGSDVACMLEMMGRWGPQEAPEGGEDGES